MQTSAYSRAQVFVGLFCVCVSLGVADESIAAVQPGSTASASLQPLAASCAVITQFTSPQVITDPGVEFTGGQFTPNAAGFPLPVQQVNSFGMDVDILPGGARVTINEIPGSITGFGSNFGPVLRLNLSDLTFSGAYLSGVAPSDVGGSTFASVTSPTSLAIDFSSFGATTYDFQFFTTVPEPATLALVALRIAVEACRRRRRD
jgi:hypothetical protein